MSVHYTDKGEKTLDLVSVSLLQEKDTPFFFLIF